MNTPETQWNILSSSPPGWTEFPVMLGRWDGDVWMDYACFSCSQLALFSNSTHWRSIKAAPPPQMRPQWELDEEAYSKWHAVHGASGNTHWAWNAALVHACLQAKGKTP